MHQSKKRPAWTICVPRTRLEFARLFLDDSYSDSACYYWLSHEINCNEGLKTDLQKLGYKKGSHILSIPQQDCIFQHFGLK